MKNDQVRFVYLDGLRGLAALVITISHFCDRVVHHALFDRIYLAVDFFFLLAGFVSCYAYEKRLLTNMSWWDFTKRRLIRLYPLYFLGFLIGLAVTIDLCLQQGTYLHKLVVPAIAHVFMLPLTYKVDFAALNPAVTMGEAFPLNLVVWALSYEIFVSLFYAAIVKRLNMPVLIGVIVAFFALCSWGVYYAGTYATGSQVPHILPAICRVGFSYFLGILIFRISRPGAGHAWLWLPLTAAFYVLLAFPTLAHGNRFVDAALLVFVLPTIVYLAAKCDMPKRLEKLCRMSGDLAYPIYMVHYPFIAIAAMLVTAYGITGWGVVGAFMACFSLILGFSMLALKFYDEPLRKWLNSVSFPKRAPVKVAA